MKNTSPHRRIGPVLWLAAMVTMSGCQQLPGDLDARLGDLDAATAGTGDANNSLPESAKTMIVGDMFDRAHELETKGASNEAIAAYKEVIQLRPTHAGAHRRLAVLYDRKGQFDESVRHYQTAIELDPNNAELLCDYGYSRFVQGDLALAEEVLRRSLAIQPTLRRAHNNLGLVLAWAGKQDKAIEAFKEAGCSESEAQENLACALARGKE